MTSDYLTFKYFDNQQKAFESNFPILQDVNETEAIHDLRVCLKKLRTLFSLFEFITPVRFNSKKTFRIFRPLFREVAIIRDIQVQQITMKETAGEAGLDCRLYLNFLLQAEMKIRQKLDHWLAGYALPDWANLKQSLNLIAIEYGDPSLREGTIHFITGRLEAVRKIVTGIPTEETLHNTRRLLKEARFMLDMINAYFTNDPYKPELQKSIKHTEDILGEWHDRMIGFHYLGDFIHQQDPMNPLLSAFCFQMLQHFLSEKEKLEKESVQSIKKITLVLS
jgi:CHAD domain-containing protein